MADAVVKKLEFSHCFAQRQGVRQLHDAARRNLMETKKVNKELDMLWQECCTPRNSELGYACADVIIALTKEGLLDGNKVVLTSVNCSSSAKNIECLLYIISQLMQMHASSQDSSFVCPYGLRVQPHPFISVLTSRPSSWNSVHLQIVDILENCDNSLPTKPALVEMIRPAVLYLLFTPSTSSEVVLTRQKLLRLLTRIDSDFNGEMSQIQPSVFSKILWPFMAYSSPDIHTLSVYKELALQHVDRRDDCTATLILKLLKFSRDNGDRCGKIIAVKSMKEIIFQFEGTKSGDELLLLGLAYVIASFPLSVMYEVLDLLKLCLDRRKSIVSKIHLQMLRVSLLQLQLAVTISNEKRILHLLNNLFSQVEEKMENLNTEVEQLDVSGKESCISTPDLFLSKVTACSILIRKLVVDHEYAAIWLRGIKGSLVQGSLKETDVSSVQNILASLLLQKIDLLRKSDSTYNDFLIILDCLAVLAQRYPKVSYSILPVAIYALKWAKGRTLLEICHLLPSLASHSLCVAPILNIIKSLSTDPSLKSAALRLMLDLWKKQDRCYPLLQKMLNMVEIGVRRRGDSYDFNVLKAIAIATVCKERPHQYGSDMLKIINPVLASVGMTKCDTVITVFALDGIFHLCKSKALNLITTWGHIGALMKNKQEHLPAKKVLDIVSLLPTFKTESGKFETLQDDILSWVWSKTESKDSMTIGAALRCLSHFSQKEFKVKHLPHSLRPAKAEDVSDEEFFDQQVTGQCFVKLLMSLEVENINEFGVFLSSLLKQELQNLPRDIHDRAMKSQLQALQPKPLKVIPEFITTLYERSKQPSMKSSLAASLLLSYVSSPELDSAGIPVPKSLVSVGRKSMDFLQNLLKELTIEPNNWQNLLWCANGWKVFMKKCITSMLEGRQAELLMQEGKSDSADCREEFEHKQATALLWCRDKLTNALKNASKGNPSMQGNAVFALTGLISALHALDGSKDEKTKGVKDVDTEYVNMPHWTVMALDTVMSIANPNHIPSGRIMSWCQYRAVSSTGKLSTTQLGTVCAIHALPHLASVSMQKHSMKVLETLAFLKREDAGTGNSMEFHKMLCMGHVLSVLYRENMTGQFGSNKLILVEECFNILHRKVNRCLLEEDHHLQDNLGSLLGLGLSISSKFKSPDPSFTHMAKETMFKLREQLDHNNLSPDSAHALATVLTWTHLCAFSSSVIAYEDVEKLIDGIRNAVYNDPSKAGYCESLGTLCNGLFLSGSGEIVRVMDQLFQQWQTIVNKQNTPTREKLAALAGFCALAGANTTLCPVAVDPSMLSTNHYLTMLSIVVKTLRQFSRTSSDPGIPSRSILLLGHLYMSLESNSSTISSILPVSYDYLPSSSILKYVFNMVSEMMKSKLQSRKEEELLEVILHSFAQSSHEFALPPVNWTSVCSAILAGKFSVNLKYDTVSLLLSQCSSSPVCASLIQSWISPNKFATLPENVSSLLYRNLDAVIVCQEDMKISELLDFMGTSCINNVAQDLGETACVSMLDGLIKALSVSKSYSPGVVEMLHNTVERLFRYLPFSPRSRLQLVLLRKVAICVEFLPDANTVVEVFEEQGIEPKNVLKPLYVRCCCTLNGTHSLSMCNDAILLLGGNEGVYAEAIWIISVCLRGVGGKMTVRDKIAWLQEVMGRTKRLFDSSDDASIQLGEYLLDVFAIAVAFWSFAGSMVPVGEDYNNADAVAHVDFAVQMFRLLLPLSISRLCSSRTWESIVQPAVDWFTSIILRLRRVKSESPWITILIAAISSSRDADDYQLPSLWCKVVSTICEVQPHRTPETRFL